MNRKLLATAICASLFATGTAYAQDTTQAAQSQDQATTTQNNTSSSKKNEKKKKTLQAITVTGSLIPQSQIETATPVITITAADLQKEGFKNVYDALHSMPIANGAVQGNSFTQGFTPGLQTVSLLGLNPDFTLVLINGKPIADYPIPYNSTSSVNDFSTIPTTLVDRIEIVPGNQSAIYGSAAIAGVINIILKQHYQGVDIDYRAGGYTDGGGQQQRFTITGGKTIGKWSLMGAIEVNKQNPIFAFQRSYLASSLDNPVPAYRVPIPNRRAYDAFTGQNIEPPGGAAGCQAIGNLYGGTEQYANNSVFGGPYCGSNYGLSGGTILNGFSQVSGYGKAVYQLNDNTQLYTDLLATVGKTKYLTGGYYSVFWEPGFGVPGYVYDIDSGHLMTGYHVFGPEEVGSLPDEVDDTQTYVFDVGIKGSLGDSNWNYDAYYHRSQYNDDSRFLRPLTAKVNAFFLGPQDGTDPFGYGYPAFHIEQTGHFWGNTTPAQFLSFSDYIRSSSETYNQQATAQVTNSDLFSLPAGSVGLALQLNGGNEFWNNPIDPRVVAGDFWGIGGTSGRGKRGFDSAAAELDIPIFKMLTADIAGRYDRYSPDGGSSQGKFTYKGGLEFRPTDTLLFRANYASAFRAPDMSYVFSNGSESFDNVVDVYNCRIHYGNNLANCQAPYNNVQITETSDGNRNLQYITAKSWGYGVVWSPTSKLTLQSDYYHVKINNEVSDYSAGSILTFEANCRIGTTIQGVPVDVNSGSCQQFLAQVSREPLNSPINPGGLLNVETLPINISRESVSGIQASGTYRWSWGRYGDFGLNLNYAVQTSHLYQQFPDDVPFDVLRSNSYGNQFKNIGTAVLSWNIGNWDTTLQYQRYGKTFNNAGSGTLGPWMTYNATLQYHVTPDITTTLIGNNIFNARPPIDQTFSSYPYYDQFSYNAYGRLVMLELSVKLGGVSDH
ncbi:MAG: TonB-dependent receptor plug domain-containing protein [Rhodanobacteraceae bacterium]